MTYKFGHEFIEWPAEMILFTRRELEKRHLSFFHPSAQKRYERRRRARPENISGDTRKGIEWIKRACNACKQYAVKPFHFRIAMPSGDIVFNPEVAIEVMWIDGKAIIHVVDVQTNYQNAGLFKGQSTEDVWDVFVEERSSVYLGHPSKIKVDQGSVFTSKKWEELSSSHGIEIILLCVESHNSIGVGKRYHEPLRKIFNILRNANQNENPEIILRYAIKGINDTMGEDGIVPTALAYGCSPSFPFMQSKIPRQRERMKMLAAAEREMATIIAKRRITKALTSELPPSTRYLIEPSNRERVLSEHSNAWV